MFHAQIFWKKCTSWWFDRVKENIGITLKEIILGLLNRNDIKKYFRILGKLCVLESRKAYIYPDFTMFLNKIKIKLETEKYVAKQNGKYEIFLCDSGKSNCHALPQDTRQVHSWYLFTLLSGERHLHCRVRTH